MHRLDPRDLFVERLDHFLRFRQLWILCIDDRYEDQSKAKTHLVKKHFHIVHDRRRTRVGQ